MSKRDVKLKIDQALPVIFAYALKRSGDRYEAEDLSQEIILSLYGSAHALREMDRFYGWMWATADNVYKTHLRKQRRHTSVTYNENLAMPQHELPENLLVDKEQIGFLYRELSILSGLYRECMVMYYIKGKSGDEIAETLKISPDMVKQYLFKSRKKVREGMNTIRERGERSFNPRKFTVYFWGTGGNVSGELFRKKLAGNIMLETFYEPVTVEELSMELGVASVYLEDEIKVLLHNGLLQQSRHNKYQSNIVIFTSEFEAELDQNTQHLYKELADYLYGFICQHEAELRARFEDCNISKNSLVWQLSTLCLVEAAINRVLDDLVHQYPALGNGTEGYMWGLERNYGDNLFDCGIQGYSDKHGNHIRLVDFALFGKQHHAICKKPAADLIIGIAQQKSHQLSEAFEETLPQLIQDGYVLNKEGSISLNLPILSSEAIKELKCILEPVLVRLSAELRDTLLLTQQILINYVPVHLRSQVPALASLKQVESFIVHTMHNMYLNRYIELPRPCTELLTAYVELASKE